MMQHAMHSNQQGQSQVWQSASATVGLLRHVQVAIDHAAASQSQSRCGTQRYVAEFEWHCICGSKSNAGMVLSMHTDAYSLARLMYRYHTQNLNYKAIDFAVGVLDARGSFLIKFMRSGAGIITVSLPLQRYYCTDQRIVVVVVRIEKDFKQRLEQRFEQVRMIKPDASRQASAEIYILAQRLKASASASASAPPPAAVVAASTAVD
jgi:23S rRNA U2552 (ribose-2'-O)-methylase RlmE/FtsJ